MTQRLSNKRESVLMNKESPQDKSKYSKFVESGVYKKNKRPSSTHAI